MTDTFDTFIEHDERDDAGDALYELAIAVGQQRREQADAARVELGEIARRLTVRWGDSTLERYGKDIGVSDRTLRDYRQVVRTLTYGAARQFVTDGVPWKVILLSTRYFPDTPGAAQSFLETAARDHMTIDEAAHALASTSASGKPPKPRVLLNGYEADIVHINYERGTVTFLIGDGVQKLVDSDPEHVTLTVTEAVRVAAAAAGGGVAS
jgi:hypothetical protein